MAEKVTVKCTSAWWHNEHFYEAGSIVVVPKGTAIPQGFLVDGVPVPTKEKVRYREVLELQDLRQENVNLRQEIVNLQKKVAELSKKSEAKKETYSAHVSKKE